MKKLKILLFLLIFIIPSVTFAGRGYNIGGGFSWSVSSGTKCCSGGRVLLGIYANKSQWRSGSAKCYIADNTAPNIEVSGYTQGEWRKSNISIHVKVTDNKSGVDKVQYIVNGVTYSGNTNFSINLTEEGWYNIQIIAYDKAKYNSYNGSYLSKGNRSTYSINVGIDKKEPKFDKEPSIFSNWLKNKPNIDYKIKDFYKGIRSNFKFKTFTCNNKPSNSSYKYPVDSNNEIKGICNISDGVNCNIDSNYQPNQNDCNWECDEGYKKSGNTCVIESKIFDCKLVKTLPSFVFKYDKNNNLVQNGSSAGLISWNSPNGVGSDGKFKAFFSESNNKYLPELDSCNFKCNSGYHNENGKCVNDVSIVCCNIPPLGELKDNGVKVDCTKEENKDKPQCTYNNLCGGYIKDVLGTWDILSNKWIYSDSESNTYDTPSNACGYENIPHSDGYTCDKKYYLTGTEGSYKCTLVPDGYYSAQENGKHSCTNKPSNSHYTSNSYSNNCSWACNSGYTKSGNKCISNYVKHDTYKCYGDNIYWYDSNNQRVDLKETCINGCSGIDCLPVKTWSCRLDFCSMYGGVVSVECNGGTEGVCTKDGITFSEGCVFNGYKPGDNINQFVACMNGLTERAILNKSVQE